jgi:hypothetical protein
MPCALQYALFELRLRFDAGLSMPPRATLTASLPLASSRVPASGPSIPFSPRPAGRGTSHDT